jgi:hypothetical protein
MNSWALFKGLPETFLIKQCLLTHCSEGEHMPWRTVGVPAIGVKMCFRMWAFIGCLLGRFKEVGPCPGFSILRKQR